MNIFGIILFLLGSFILLGFPAWNLARLRGNKNALWWIVPPAVIICLVWFSRSIAESSEYFTFFKSFGFYLVIFALMLFGATLFAHLIAYIFRLSKKQTFILIVSCAIIYFGGAVVNGQRIVVKDLDLPAENITREYNFVQITDLHAGSTDKAWAARVSDIIADLNPEFVVITGDFIDESYVTADDISPFNNLEMPIYLITGNHEYYVEDGTLERVLKDSNIELIDREKVTYNELDIYGVGELQSVDGAIKPFGGIDPNRYSIILDHQPKEDEAIRASENGAELMLSGHTHKGQIWPFSFLVEFQFKYLAGLYEIGDMFLYVNQGTGTLGPQMRVGSVNEITFISLLPSL